MEKNELLIASYIHDIGKLLWRGGYNRKYNNYKIAHSEIMKEFFDNIEGLSEQWKKVVFLASLHHKSDFDKFKEELSDEEKFLAWCIYMADNISATERLDENETKLQDVRKHPIKNIFSSIFLQKEGEIIDYYKDTYFDASTIEDHKYATLNNSNKIDFKYLSEKFISDFKTFIKDNPTITERTIYQLDILLQKYFTFVPSDAYKSIPDISLYDHSKTVVAFADLLYNFYKDKINFYTKKTDDIKKAVEVSIIAGDFPSIQKYIFNGILKSENITKRLRARSFFIQLLQEAVLQYVLDKLSLSRANVLINAGGKFVILSSKIDNIVDIKESINTYLLDKFPGLRFSLEKLDISLDLIVGENNNFKQILVELFDSLGESKFKVYTENNFEKIFNSDPINGKILCKYCGKSYVDKKEIDNENEAQCENCRKEIRLGEKLVKLDSLSFDYIDKNGKFKFDFDIENNEGDFKLIFNKWDYTQIDTKGIAKSINLYVPKNDNQVKTFQEISLGNYLAMFKGDIDNMSLIFKYGFDYGQNSYSISRILSFSRLLELYFGVYFQKFLEENFTNVYTVFSGGDDFVFILSLDNVEKFVSAIYDNFFHFTKNDKIHFSLGIGLFKDKTPIKFVYENSENLLSQAKNKSKEKIQKVVNRNELDALKYFGICFAEEDNIKVLNKYDEDLFKLDWLVKNVNKYSTMLYKLYKTLKLSKKYLEEDNYSDYILLGARLLYMLKRNIYEKDFKKIGNKPKILVDVEDIFKNMNNKEEKINKISEILLKLSYNIYKSRD